MSVVLLEDEKSAVVDALRAELAAERGWRVAWQDALTGHRDAIASFVASVQAQVQAEHQRDDALASLARVDAVLDAMGERTVVSVDVVRQALEGPHA